MIDLTPHNKPVDPVAEIHATKPREKEYKMVGKMRPIPGLRFWSIDSEGKIEEVVIDRTAYVGMDGKSILKQKAHVDPRKRYCQALNRRNAARKFQSDAARAREGVAEGSAPRQPQAKTDPDEGGGTPKPPDTQVR